jgi:hypothetical protein
MKTRRLVTATVVALVWLAAAPNVEAFRFYRFGGVGRAVHYNTWTGGIYHGGVAGYNPYTGRYAAGRAYYNPYTGRYGYAGEVYNPYTNRYAYRYGYGGW